MTLLPLATVLGFALIFLALYRRAAPCGHTDRWRDAFLLATVIWGVCVAAITQLLGRFDRLTFGWVLASWGLVGLVALGDLVWPRDGRPLAIPPPRIPRQAPGIVLPLCGVAAIVAATGVVAVLAPPNTWDSMTYHMSRVVHWIQNGSVAYYPTHIPRQLYQAPWAEYAILQFQILSGGDRWANLIQWFAMCGSLVGVSLIARELGAETRGQALAATTAATIPMGILQASSTQTDFVAGLWLVVVAYYTLRFRDSANWAYAIPLGAGLGLATLTKSTAYIFALPFLIGVAIVGVRALRLGAWKPALAITLLLLALNLDSYARTWALYGSPVGYNSAESDAQYANQTLSIAVIASNAARNLTLHLAMPSERANRAIEAAVRRAHRALGLDADDPRTTWFGWRYEVQFVMHEDYAGNLLHLCLAAIALVACLAYPPLRRRRDLLLYFAAIGMGCLLFVAYLQWQPWHSRLHLPLFVLLAPAVATAFAALPQRWTVGVVGIILLAGALPWLLRNDNRPLAGANSVLVVERDAQYFSNRPLLRESYAGAAEMVRALGCTEVGLVSSHDDWEYPLWVTLDDAFASPVRIEHIFVTNSTRDIVVPRIAAFHPCAIISINPALNPALATAFTEIWSSDHVAVFVRP